MKRIYLIGVLMVLLVIAAVDYFYIKENKQAHAQNTPIAKDLSSTEKMPGHAVDNAPVRPVKDVVVKPVVQYHKSRAFTGWNGRKHKNGRAKKTVTRTTISQPVTQRKYVVKMVEGPQRIKTNLVIEAMQPVASSREYHGRDPRINVTKKRVEVMPRRPLLLGSRTIQFGPEIGFNMNEFYNNNTDDMMTGYMNAGIAINIRIGDHVALQPTPRYIVKGNRVGDNMDANVKEKLSLHYISMPVDLVYKFGKPGTSRVMLGAGPYVAYMAGTHHFYTNPGFMDVIDPPKPAYNTAWLQDIDWGVNSFIGIESPEGLFVKAGVEYGLKDIQRNPVTGRASDRNYSLLFSVGCLLGGVK